MGADVEEHSSESFKLDSFSLILVSAYMEHQKGLSNDTDSKTSNASSKAEHESTGFSATPDKRLSSSVFDASLDASQLDLDSHLDALRSQNCRMDNNPLGSDCDILWNQMQLQSHKMMPLSCLASDQRPRSIMSRDRFGISSSIENYTDSSLFRLSSNLGGAPQSIVKPELLWNKCEEFAHDAFTESTTSPGEMASKFLNMQTSRQGYMPVPIASSSGTHAEAEVNPPAEKKMRSMMRMPIVGKQEYSLDPIQCPQEPGQVPIFQGEALESFMLSNTTKYILPPQSAELEKQQRRRSEEKAKRIQVLGVRGVGSVMGTRELNTMEQLLVQCATALEVSDITYAQQTIFVINNIAAADGDPNQRLLAHFLRALILRASKFTPHLLPGNDNPHTKSRKLKTVLELTNYIDVMPWYRFGFIAANGAILEAFEGKEKVHILDLNISHCMQWPTLIESLAERNEGPPQLRLTVCVSKAPIPPLLDVPYDELIIRLAKFARSKNVPFEYQLLFEDIEKLDVSKIGIREGEVLAVNCLFRLHYVTDECTELSTLSPREEVLYFIRKLNPAIVTLTEDDASLTSPKLVTRLKAAFNYFWIPFDALHTLLPKECQQRLHCEDEVANKIENLIACEGKHRIERVEAKDRWVQRMKRARFHMVSFSEDVVTENKLMLGEHSGCWGLRKDEDEDVLFLTWKGHNVSFSTAWLPANPLLPLR